MKAMLFAFVAIAVIAVAADFALDYTGYSIMERTAGANVRLD
ncbi:hypothetical protein [Tranquillimonas alkanivorans]|uniref:Uncharacterized protein n=1 Tax=Tranquillimonas alkanivorans TaxID=441119 RepID=A0A1I5KIT0_9RHOB|nr:hypothetical protein [Tranquillimonas alkanivorans]SFO84960.1 hypothetical protein SAMN04488047_101137 [Tranquillimonas alkanivorans]